MTTRWWHRMVNLPKAAVALGAVLAAASGCSTDSGTQSSSTSSSTGGTPDAGAGCRVARDCGGGFECRVTPPATTGVCIKLICESDADCTLPELCDVRRGICTPEACEDAACPPGEFCVNSTDAQGEPISICGNPPAANLCSLDVNRFALRAAQTRQVAATGYLTSGAQVPRATFTYASSDMAKASVSATGLVTGVATGTATITVTPAPSGTPCTAEVTVYGNVDAADARAVIFDNKNGRPLSGVTVQLRKTTGAPVVVETDSSGVANFTGGGPASEILDISAFPAAHSWVTYSRPGTNDVAMFADPVVPADKVAGVTGTFNTDLAAPPAGDIKLGLAAFSIAGALSDLNLAGLIGKTVPTDINIPSISVMQMDVPLPSGVYLKLSQDNIKERVDMYVDGPCTTADPCRRVLWGLGGQVALSKIGPIISEVAGGTGDVDAGKILSAVLPFFRKFYHYAKGGFSLTDVNAPTGDNFPVFGGAAVTVTPNYLLNQNATWTIPNLPSLPTDSTKTVSGALVLTGAYVPGQGMVPLGVTAGLDKCPEMNTAGTCVNSGMADGLISCVDDNATTSYHECDGLLGGDIVVDYAPPHDGLEGYRLATVAVALDVDSLGAGGLFTSVIVSFNNTIASTGKNTFPAGSFLGFNRGSWSVATRTYAATSAVTGADFYRVNLDTNGNPWYVYFSATGSTFSVEVPPVAAGVTTDRVANQDIQAFKLLSGEGNPTTFTQLVEFNSSNFDNVINYTGAFSTQECVAITPVVECTANAGCESALGSADFTCDAAGVCVNAEAGVTVKGAGACAAGTEEVTANGKSICSQIPACRKTP